MTFVRAILILAMFSVSARAFAESDDSRRKFGLFAGFGFDRTFATVQQPGVSTTLGGWGNYGEAGMDVAFSGKFGFTTSIEVGDSDLRNSYKAADYLDQTTIKSKAVRGGFYFKNITLGGGYRQLVVDLKTVSATTGAATAHLEGNGTFGYGAFTIDHRGLFRGALEVQANTMELSGFTYTDYTVGLRAYLLLNGLLD